MTRRTRRGFTLVEAAVAVAVVGILAGMITPMAVRVLNQRRAASTRNSLRLAFEAMFGSRDRRVANMRADFAFNPTRSYDALPFLVTRCWGNVPPFELNAQGAAFPSGYNGPYWLGPVRNGNPVDAWGHPIGLIYDAAKETWQLHSLGPDKTKGDDDLYYPATPAAVGSFKAAVLLVIQRDSEDIGGTVRLRCGGNQDSGLCTVKTYPIDARSSPQSFSFQAPAGGMELNFQPGTGAFKPFTIPMDLLPGQTREVQVRL